MPDIILSICIPTYNRGQVLYTNIKKWLETDNQQFEIVVSDNCSEDNTLEFLNSINDKRLKILSNDKNYGGYINGQKALNAGSGKYIMQLTDKDFIDMKSIDKIIPILSELDVASGCFISDIKSDEDTYVSVVSNKIKKFYKFCFRGNHPSGFFFNRELFHKINAFEVCMEYDKALRAYLTDFLTTLLCNYGDAAFVHIPFIFLVKPPFNDLKHSLTYSPGNLFFLPENRFKVFEVYLDFLSEINLNFLERAGLVCQLVKTLYNFSTADYIKVLNNKEVCSWYAVPEEFIEEEKSKNLDKCFIQRLANCKHYASLFEKTYVLLAFLKWFYIKRKMYYKGT